MSGEKKGVWRQKAQKGENSERGEQNEDGCEDHMTLRVYCVCVPGQVEWEVLMEKQYGKLFKLATKCSFSFNV